MKSFDGVAVCSRSFSKNIILRQELLLEYPRAIFNDAGEVLSGDRLIEFIGDNQKTIIGLEVLDEYVLSRLPNLQVVSKYGVGLDMIDIDAMRRLKKSLGWTAGVNRRSVAELVLSTSILMLRGLAKVSDQIGSGEWRQIIGSQLTGKRVGIIGCGNVGKDFIKLLTPFDCEVCICDPVLDEDFMIQYKVKALKLDDLLSISDIISIHVPLLNSTRNLLSREKLNLMRNTSILINTSRGGIVDEDALKDILKNKKILGAVFDVFKNEPPEDSELLGLNNFFATPHVGGSSVEAVLAMGRAAIEGLEINAVP